MPFSMQLAMARRIMTSVVEYLPTWKEENISSCHFPCKVISFTHTKAKKYSVKDYFIYVPSAVLSDKIFLES